MATSVSASGSMTSYWIKFFKDCGIPAGEATNYAITFTDNRISESMLLDLNKEYLADMGISVLGDVIAILKHAKTVQAQETAKQRALRAATATDVTPSPRRSTPLRAATATDVTPSPKRSTPASRTVNHYLGADPEAQPMNAPAKPGPKMSKELAARLGPTPEPSPPAIQRIRLTPKAPDTPLSTEPTAPKVRRVLPEHEGRYKIIMPQGTTERSRRALQQQDQVPRPKKGSVFGRLGGENPSEESDVKITGLGKVIIRNTGFDEASVFKRLGKATKRAATSTSADSGDDDTEEEAYTGVVSPLEYVGVLKQDEAAKARLLNDKKKALEKRKLLQAAAAKKKVQLEAALARKKQLEQRLGPQKTEVTTTAGILSLDAKQETRMRNRLGHMTVVTAASSTTTVSSTTPKPPAKSGVHARLGRQHTEVSSTVSPPTAKGGVFQRLGKPVS